MDSSKPGETRSLDSLGSEESPSHMIFVGGLPQDADEEALRLYFSLFGAVSDVEVKRSLKGKSKGFGFVWFESNSSVDAAVKHPQHMVLNTPFNVQIAEDPKAKKRQQDDRKSRKILVGNIPKDKKQQEIKVLLERIGPVDKVTQFRSRNDGTYYCYAIMVNFADAEKLLQMKKLKSNDGVKLKFKPYEKESEAVLQPPGKSEELSSVKERKQNTIGWPANPPDEAGFPKLADMWGTPKFGAKKSVNVQNVLIGPQKSEERPEPFLHQVKAPQIARRELRIRRYLEIDGLPLSRRSSRRTCSLEFQRAEQSLPSSGGLRSQSIEEPTYRFNLGRKTLPNPGLQ